MDYSFFLKNNTTNIPKAEYSMMDYGDICIECYNYKDKYTVTPAMIIKLLEIIPASHLLKLGKILYEPILYNPVKKTKINLSIKAGLYHSRGNDIFIGDISEHRQLAKTLYHEIGHHVKIKIFGNYDLGKWISLSCNSEEYVSDYAKVSINEDFAETYSFYLTDPEMLKKLSMNKFNFVNELFSKTEYRIIENTQHGWIG